MRNSSIVYSRIWMGGTGQQILKDYGHEHFTVAVYLITTPHAHMSGIYWIVPDVISRDVHLSTDRIIEIVGHLEQIGFCRFDLEKDIVWVIKMCRYQLGKKIKQKDNRIAGIRNHLEALPESHLKTEFLEYYGLSEAPPEGSPEGASKGSHKESPEGANQGTGEGSDGPLHEAPMQGALSKSHPYPSPFPRPREVPPEGGSA